MRRNIVIYWRLAGARARADLQYRASLALLTFGTFVGQSLEFATIAILFGQVPALAGWDLAEVAFLYGTAGMSFGLADLAVGSVDKVGERIRQGTFDTLLVRPVGTLLQLATEELALRRIGKVAQPAVVLAFAVTRVDVEWSLGTVTLTVVTIVAGTFIAGAIWVTATAATFWTIEGREAANAVTYGGGALTQYPLPVYSEVVRSLAVVVPVAFVSYLPSVAVLDKVDPLGVPAALRYASPLVAVASVVVATVAWRFAVRHYRSTGS